MSYILHSLPRNLEFLGGRLGRFLYELMQEDNPTTYNRAVEHSRNSLRGLDSEFKKPATHCPGMGHAQIWTKCLHPLGVSQESNDKASREIEDFILDPLAVKGNAPSHDTSIAYPLLCRSRGVAMTANVPHDPPRSGRRRCGG